VIIDLTHTSHTEARTGIQRVTRGVYAALGSQGVPICHDPFARSWRELSTAETNRLHNDAVAAAHRGARWSWGARWSGTVRRLIGSAEPVMLPRAIRDDSLLVPEVFSPSVGAALPALLTQIGGPRAALFHDAIALKLPELTPSKTVARFPAYLRELLMFDGIAAVSEDSRRSLVDYWRWLGVENQPPVVSIPLGIDVPKAPAAKQPSAGGVPVVLSVGSLEGRKNHLALLDACERLWNSGQAFALRLVGLAHPQTGRAALEKIGALQAAGRPVRYDGPVSDAVLESAYTECAFTVYPSLLEGFGLPVLESLVRGRPCICSARGALGEAAAGGGCRSLDRVDAETLAVAIGELLASPTELATLGAVGHSRTFKTWPAYAGELASWMKSLRRRG
jgi:glycosyltransferase involved in cell wall biosynthesis